MSSLKLSFPTHLFRRKPFSSYFRPLTLLYLKMEAGRSSETLLSTATQHGVTTQKTAT